MLNEIPLWMCTINCCFEANNGLASWWTFHILQIQRVRWIPNRIKGMLGAGVRSSAQGLSCGWHLWSYLGKGRSLAIEPDVPWVTPTWAASGAWTHRGGFVHTYPPHRHTRRAYCKITCQVLRARCAWLLDPEKWARMQHSSDGFSFSAGSNPL